MTWHRVASLAEAERAHPWLAADVAGVSVVLAQLDTRWYGVEDRCTHAGCPFSEEATLEAGTIDCHCHGSQFDLRNGQPLQLPAYDPVPVFAVELHGDDVYVDVTNVLNGATVNNY